jgi:cell division protein FtsX
MNKKTILISSLIALVLGAVFFLFLYGEIDKRNISEGEYNDAMVEMQRDIIISLISGAKESDVSVLMNNIRSQSYVESLAYTSEVEGLEEFRNRHKDDPLVMEALKTTDENPVSGKFEIKLKKGTDKMIAIEFIHSIDTKKIVGNVW